MNVSSFKVIMQFVRYLEPTSESAAPRLDVRGVLSRECFETWLNTRQNTIKHPEQAFHRILLCHLRGSDTRTPFPPEVEAAILEVLRSEEASGLWDRCFNGNLLQVGKHGFRGLGYHEKLAAAKSDPPKQSQVDTTSDNNSFEIDVDLQEMSLPFSNDNNRCTLPKLSSDDQNGNIIFQVPESQVTLSHGSQKMKSLFEELFGVSNPSDYKISRVSFRDTSNPKRDQAHVQGLFSVPSLQSAVRPKLWTAISGGPDGLTPWERLRQAAEQLHRYDNYMQGLDPITAELIMQLVGSKTGSSSNRLMITNNGKETSSRTIDSKANRFVTQMFSPAVEYMLRQKIPFEYDERFDPCFIFPNDDLCFFSGKKPVGWWRTDTLSRTITELSDEAKVLLRGDYSGMYMYSPLASLFHFWYGCSLKLPKNNDWVRMQLLRRDGTIGLFLTNITIWPDHSHIIYFQEISEEYRDALNKPFLI